MMMPGETTAPPPLGPSEPLGSGDWRLERFNQLMPRRVEEILLVSSPYDSFMLEEDGLLTEMIFSEYQDLGLSHAPRVARVGNGEEALQLLRERNFDLVFTMLRLGGMDVQRFGAAVREIRPDLPVVLLVANDGELKRFNQDSSRALNVDAVYVWHGNAKLFPAIIKAFEDKWNVASDTKLARVGTIILIEDSVRFRSQFLPMLYTELVRQAQSVVADSINRAHRLLRLRARPKILVCEDYEQALEYYNTYRKYLFGVITDVRFQRGGREDAHAGLEFVRFVKSDNRDLPCLVVSSETENRPVAEALGAGFADKHAHTLHAEIREFMLHNFGFGDFIFRMPDQQEVARASDLRSMTRALEQVPLASVLYHASRDHFSNWLRARSEFDLAARLRPRRVEEFRDLEGLRRYLIWACIEAMRRNRQGTIEDFSPDRFDAGSRFARIGAGSLGGKARGLAFYDSAISRHRLDRAFPNVRIQVPRSVVLGTDVFDQFIDGNGLRDKLPHARHDADIRALFLAADLPDWVIEHLAAYLAIVRYPVAVRSSSLAEDSLYHPFAGVYSTYMTPNNDGDMGARLRQLGNAIKLVYASMYYDAARRYLASTPYHLEEQKMAVLLQQVVGKERDGYFYPSISGVVRSYNFYPFGQMSPEDGVAYVALGHGMTVVEGGAALRFCPAHPLVLPQLGHPREFIGQSQRTFLAIDLSRTFDVIEEAHGGVVEMGLDVAEKHGTLAPVGSVWSPENEALYDGIYRPGVRVVTFAHVLKSDLFPLAPILQRVLEIGKHGMNAPVEIEFAANLDTEPREFAVLQIRPYSVSGESQVIDLGELPHESVLCYSAKAMGNGATTGIADVIYVKPRAFDAAKTGLIARQIGDVNDALREAGRNCVLLGPGRWGSSNSWLGIPVQWGQISTAKLIVETSLEGFAVDPSQGSHFFHNLTSFGVAYFTVNQGTGDDRVDWDWLDRLTAVSETDFIRHVRTPEPLEIRIDGRESRGAILKHGPRVE